MFALSLALLVTGIPHLTQIDGPVVECDPCTVSTAKSSLPSPLERLSMERLSMERLSMERLSMVVARVRARLRVRLGVALCLCRGGGIFYVGKLGWA